MTGNYTLVPGSPPLNLSVLIPDDEYVENDEQWSLIISQPEFPPLTIQFIIIDNDGMSENPLPPSLSFIQHLYHAVCVDVTVGFANDSEVRVGEGEVVRVCVELGVSPSLLQREISLEGSTSPGTAEGTHI